MSVKTIDTSIMNEKDMEEILKDLPPETHMQMGITIAVMQLIKDMSSNDKISIAMSVMSTVIYQEANLVKRIDQCHAFYDVINGLAEQANEELKTTKH